MKPAKRPVRIRPAAPTDTAPPNGHSELACWDTGTPVCAPGVPACQRLARCPRRWVSGDFRRVNQCTALVRCGLAKDDTGMFGAVWVARHRRLSSRWLLCASDPGVHCYHHCRARWLCLCCCGRLGVRKLGRAVSFVGRRGCDYICAARNCVVQHVRAEFLHRWICNLVSIVTQLWSPASVAHRFPGQRWYGVRAVGRTRSTMLTVRFACVCACPNLHMQSVLASH